MSGETDPSTDTVGTERPSVRRTKRFARKFRRNQLAVIGLGVLGLFTLAAVFAPEIAPYDPTVTDVPDRLAPPGAEQPM
jgi:ABC-type antimicrobial peptide transport system permease subunit